MKIKHLTGLLSILLVVFVLTQSIHAASPADRPNIILMMADDMGWGDPAFNGNKIIKTPNLDAMAASGLKFNRFYAAAPVCSPTRGSCVTGRHPFRYGVFFANTGHIKPEEATLAEMLKKLGYATGHFGKWHLGTLTKTEDDSNRGGPRGVANYAPPWDNGFDVCFSTEAKVPTYDPMLQPGTDRPYGTAYWLAAGKRETENLQGDDSRIIVDRVVPFIRAAAKQKKPFFAIVWFHTPHLPVVAGPKHLAMYKEYEGIRPHYYGCITALDDQVGRLRNELQELGVRENTMLWFCSDNGPEGSSSAPGSAGPFRGRKRSLFEGGVRVPGLLEWPAKVKPKTVTDLPVSTSDYLPTIVEVLGIEMADGRPLDGVSLVPLIEGRMHERPRPIGFQSSGQVSLVDNRYKIIRSGNRNRSRSKGSGKGKEGKAATGSQSETSGFMLFDLIADPSETKDLAAEHPEIVQRMVQTLKHWQASCEKSLAGEDYR